SFASEAHNMWTKAVPDTNSLSNFAPDDAKAK
nr:DUF4231 domain-containing protein [Vibrio anguillarum]